HLTSFEEPSWRFPISPLAKRMSTTPGSRLFIYTGVPYVPDQAACEVTASEADQ
ncbi:PPOX2, partial [Symbiodinium natans]